MTAGKAGGRTVVDHSTADPATPDGLLRISKMVTWERHRFAGMVRATLAERLLAEVYRLREVEAARKAAEVAEFAEGVGLTLQPWQRDIVQARVTNWSAANPALGHHVTLGVVDEVEL